MQGFRVAGWLMVLVLGARAGMSQVVARKDSTTQVTISAPIRLPLIMSLSTLPQRLSVEDSLDRLVYARNRVKTATLLRQRSGRPADTTEYVELDRRGNKVLVAKPYLGAHRRQAFDKRNQLLESVQLPTPDFSISTRLVYEPKTQLHTTFVTVRDAAPVLWQQAQKSHRGDTLTTEAIFQPVPNLNTSPVHRLLMRQYRLGADTCYVEVVGYDAADQPTDFSAYYNIGAPGQARENGKVEFQASPHGEAKSAAQLVQLSRHGRGRLVPDTYNRYDAKGRLIQSTYRSTPNATPTKPVTSKSVSADGQASITISDDSPIASYSTRYRRTPDGRIQREDRTYELRPGITDPSIIESFKPSFIEYEYGPTGLLLRKTDSASLTGKPVVYEVKYTYY